MHTTQFSNLIPNTPDGSLIYLSNDIEDSLERSDEYNFYLSMHKHVVATARIVPRMPGFPNPYNISQWDRYAWKESPTATTSASFVDITDQRAEEVSHYAKTNDLPIIISYSGGIDSTLIVAAIHKNWEKSLKDRVIIKMSNASYFENPYFFNDIIKHNFYFTNLTNSSYDFNNAIVIPGEPGDAITFTNSLIQLDTIYPGVYQQSVRTSPDKLLNWLSTKVETKYANMFYERMLDSADMSGMQLETYEDFFWYSKQALTYNVTCVRMIEQLVTPWTEHSWDNYQNNAIPWFDTEGYRLWSQTNRNNGVKYNGTYGSFKMPFKQYINDVYHNEYYLNYKAKRGSPTPKTNKIAALFDDGTLYYLGKKDA
jgi:hypothetical protein